MTPEEISNQIDRVNRNEQDDIIRALWFHVRSFRGEQAELADIENVIHRLAPLELQKTAHLSEPDGDQARRTEKALHRLVVIGVVQDYTVAYPTDFEVRLSGANQRDICASFSTYVSSYQRGLGINAQEESIQALDDDHLKFVLNISEFLIRFIYTHIERARRRSLSEILLAASQASTGDDLRIRILDYLQNSEFDSRLEAVVASSVGGLDALEPLFDDLISSNDAMALRGSVARLLGSYPDNPGLLLLRGLSEVLSQDGSLETGLQNLQAGIGFALGEYRRPDSIDLIAPAIGKIVTSALKKEGAAESLIIAALEVKSLDRDMVRRLLRDCPPEVVWLPAAWLANQLNTRSAAMLSR